jgi:hypothetical protein
MDPLDAAGQSIVRLLHRAAGVAEQNSRHAVEVAQKLSVQLQEAEARIRDLEADVRYHPDRAERAEKWLYQISVEIEERFFNHPDRVPPQHSLFQSGRRSAPYSLRLGQSVIPSLWGSGGLGRELCAMARRQKVTGAKGASQRHH